MLPNDRVYCIHNQCMFISIKSLGFFLIPLLCCLVIWSLCGGGKNFLPPTAPGDFCTPSTIIGCTVRFRDQVHEITEPPSHETPPSAKTTTLPHLPEPPPPCQNHAVHKITNLTKISHLYKKPIDIVCGVL